MQGNSFRARMFKSSAEFLRQYPQVHDDSDIVQQAGKIRFAGIKVRDFAGEIAAHQRTA